MKKHSEPPSGEWAAAAAGLKELRLAPSRGKAEDLVTALVTLGLNEVPGLDPNAAPLARARLRTYAEGLLVDPGVSPKPAVLREAVLCYAREVTEAGPGGQELLPLAEVLTSARHDPPRDHAPALGRIRGILGLSDPELARLLGVTRQALEQWRERGIPARRSADVDRLAAAAEWLAEELIAERIPQIVRTPVPALGGRTMLDHAKEEGSLAWLEHLAMLFSMQTTA